MIDPRSSDFYVYTFFFPQNKYALDLFSSTVPLNITNPFLHNLIHARIFPPQIKVFTGSIEPRKLGWYKNKLMVYLNQGGSTQINNHKS